MDQNHPTILKCDENYELEKKWMSNCFLERKNWLENIVKIQMGTKWEAALCNSYLYRVQRANKAPFSAHAAFHSSFIVDITRQASSFAFHFSHAFLLLHPPLVLLCFKNLSCLFRLRHVCWFLLLMFYVLSRRTDSTLCKEITFLCFSFSIAFRETRESKSEGQDFVTRWPFNGTIHIAFRSLIFDETMEVNFHYSEDKFLSKQLRDKFSELDGDFWWPSELRQWSWKIKREMLCDILLAIINFIVWHRNCYKLRKTGSSVVEYEGRKKVN